MHGLNERPDDYWLNQADFAAIPAEELEANGLRTSPLVSVLMLAWNHAEFIDQAIGSVVNQQCDFPFELIIGEDCSSDTTLPRSRVWKDRFPETIRIVTAEKNVGMHRNFARIWHRARGDYMAMCEGDDYWVDPLKLQKQVEWFHSNPRGSMVGTFTDKVVQSSGGKWMVSGRLAPLQTKEHYDLPELLQSYSFHFSSVMTRKNAVRFPSWFWQVYCVDRPLYLLAAERGVVGLLPIVTSCYRQHQGGLWSPLGPAAKGEASTALFQNLKAHLDGHYVKTCRQTLSDILWFYMSEAMQTRDWAAARKLYWQSLRVDPVGLLLRNGLAVVAVWLRLHFPAAYRTLKEGPQLKGGPEMSAITVVMGIYNDAATLVQTLDSVLEQGLPDFEFIVVNDGSTDSRVQEILTDYQKTDRRLKPVSKPNEGLTRALIDGCNLAQGHYIARIDAGDMMLPGRLHAQAKVLNDHPDCTFVSCWTEFCGPQWEPMWLAKGRPEMNEPGSILPDEPETGLSGDVPHHGSVMFRRSAYEKAGGYREAFYCGQDWDLWYRLAELGTYQVVQQPLYRARFFPDSISMMGKCFQDEAAHCSSGAFIARRRGQSENEWLQRAKACHPSTARRAEHAFRQSNHEPGFYFIGEALRRRGDPRSRRYLAEAMRQSPASARAYIRWLQSWLPRGDKAA